MGEFSGWGAGSHDTPFLHSFHHSPLGADKRVTTARGLPGRGTLFIIQSTLLEKGSMFLPHTGSNPHG